jgi:hypothetical protein
VLAELPEEVRGSAHGLKGPDELVAHPGQPDNCAWASVSVWTLARTRVGENLAAETPV